MVTYGTGAMINALQLESRVDWLRFCREYTGFDMHCALDFDETHMAKFPAHISPTGAIVLNSELG